jgi:transcriptional regulator with XRE-family HTH domain
LATGKQIRAARVLLEWEAKELADRTGVSVRSILNFERGEGRPKPATMEKIIKAFTVAGVEFIDGEGLRRRTNDVEVFEGHDRFHDFTEFVYAYLRQHGGDVCISAVDERLFIKYRREPELYRQRMKELVDSGKVIVRILAEESKFNSLFAQYKRLPKQNSVPVSFYAFGSCLALISFAHNPSPHVVLLKSTPFADVYRQSFNEQWAKALQVKA